jgi:hypothetical protein
MAATMPDVWCQHFNFALLIWAFVSARQQKVQVQLLARRVLYRATREHERELCVQNNAAHGLMCAAIVVARHGETDAF